jgi:radical SAM superfamily enzyme YgiQ (UPF0313 family)
MKILLIAVSSEGSLTSTIPDKYRDLSLGHYPPLGLMYLAAYLEKHSTHRAEIIDTEIDGLDVPALTNRLLREKPGAVGFYTTSFNIHLVHATVLALKRAGVTAPVILGGPHVDLFPEETAALEGVAYAAPGEGEATLAELLDVIEKGGNLSDVRGVCYTSGGKVIVNPPRPMLEKLDDLPLPARRLTKFDRYYSVIGREKVSTTLMTSRGCPFRCNFCFVQYGGRYRTRSADSIITEIEDCLGLGINEFFFFDEIFTADRRRVLEFCAAVERRGLKIIFDIRSRADTIDEEMLLALKRAGCVRIQYGIESGTDEILLAMNKKITLEQARKAVAATKKAGIGVLLDFMIGYPGETREQIRRTVAFARELNPTFVQFGITTLFPGTRIYDDALRGGTLKEDFWRRTARDPRGPIVPPCASDRFDRLQLERILREAYLSFYFRPVYILKRLAELRSWVALRRQLKAGWNLLSGK